MLVHWKHPWSFHSFYFINRLFGFFLVNLYCFILETDGLSTQTNNVQFNSLPVMPMAMHCAMFTPMFTLKINLLCKTFFFFNNAWNPFLLWQLSLVEMMCHREAIIACFKSYTALSKQNFILQGETNRTYKQMFACAIISGSPKDSCSLKMHFKTSLS